MLVIFHLNGVALCFSGKEGTGSGERSSLPPHKVPLVHTKDYQALPQESLLFESHLELLRVKLISTEKTLFQSLEEHFPSEAKHFQSPDKGWTLGYTGYLGM